MFKKIGLAVAFLCHAHLILAAEVTFDVVVSNGDEETEADSVFLELEAPPAIDTAGNIYFEARNGPVGGSMFENNVWLADPSNSLQAILRASDPAPGVMVNGMGRTLSGLGFDDFGVGSSTDAVVTENGGVFFRSSRFASSGFDLFFRSSDGTVRNIARASNTASSPADNETVTDNGINYADGRGNTLRGFLTGDGSATLRANAAGRVAYQGQFVGFEVINAADSGVRPTGIFAGSTRLDTRVVAFNRTSAVGVSGTWDNLRLLAVTANGDVYFRGDISDGTEGIWRDRFGVIELVAQTGTVLAGSGTSDAFLAVSGGLDNREISVNSNGEIAILGLIGSPGDPDDAQLAIWRGMPGALTPIIIGNDNTSYALATDDGTVNAAFFLRDNRFEDILLSDNGDVLFTGQYDDADQNLTQINNGVFRIAAGSQEATQIISGGADFTLAAINDAGQAIFETGTSFQTLFAFDARDGVTQLLTSNQETDFGVVSGFEVIVQNNGAAGGDATSFNDAGQLAIAVFQPGGTSGVDSIVRTTITFETLLSNVFRFEGGCADVNWHSDCADTNWVDEDGDPQSRVPGRIGDENVIIQGRAVEITDEAVTVASLEVDIEGSLTVQQELTINGDASIANLILRAALNTNGTTDLINPDIQADIETPLNASFTINGTQGTWSAGTFTGVSAVNIDSDARLTVTDDVSLGTRLEVNGALQVNNGDLRLEVNAGLTNDGTLTLDGESSITNFDTDIPSFFTNNGSLVKRGLAPATITSDFVQTGDGVTIVEEGQLSLVDGTFQLAGQLGVFEEGALILAPQMGSTTTLSNLLLDGDGQLTFLGGNYQLGSQTTTVSLGSRNPQVGEASGLVLDGVELIEGTNARLNIAGAASSGTRLIKTGDVSTTIRGVDVVFENALVEVEGGLNIEGGLQFGSTTVQLADGAALSVGDGTQPIRVVGETLVQSQGTLQLNANTQVEDGARLNFQGGLIENLGLLENEGELTLAQVMLENGITGQLTNAGLLRLSGNAHIAVDPVSRGLDNRSLVNTGLLRVSGADNVVETQFMQDVGGALVLDAGELTLAGGTMIDGRIEISQGASLTLSASNTPHLFSGSEILGEGQLVITQGEFQYDSPMPVTLALGTEARQVESGLVLDNVEFFGPTNLFDSDIARLTIGRMEGPQSRLIKRGSNSTSLSNVDFENALVRVEDGSISFLFLDATNTVFDVREPTPTTFITGLTLNAHEDVQLIGDGLSSWRDVNVLEGGRLVALSDLAISNSLAGVDENNRLSIGGGAEVSLSGSVSDLDITVAEDATSIDDLCGVVCLASVVDDKEITLEIGGSGASAAVDFEPLGQLTIGEPDGQFLVRRTAITNEAFGLIQIQGDVDFGSSTLTNESQGVIELHEFAGALQDVLGSGSSLTNLGIVDVRGAVTIGIELAPESTGTILAMPGFEDTSIQFESTIFTPDGDAVIGSWDLTDTNVMTPSSTDSIRFVTPGQRIRLAGETSFPTFTEDLTGTTVQPGGTLILDSLSSGGVVLANLFQRGILVGGTLQLIDTNLVGDGVVDVAGTFQTNAEVGGSVAVRDGGRFVIGASPGRAVVAGDYSQAGALDIELGAGAAGVGYDQLVVAGTAAFTESAVINISLLPDGDAVFIPENGTTFDLIQAANLTSAVPISELIRLTNAPTGFRFDLEQIQSDDGTLLQLTTFLGSDLAAISTLPMDLRGFAQALDSASLSNQDEMLTDLILAIDGISERGDQLVALRALSHSFTSALFDYGRVSQLNRQFGVKQLFQAHRQGGNVPAGTAQDLQALSGFSSSRGVNNLKHADDWIQLASRLSSEHPTRTLAPGITGTFNVHYTRADFETNPRGADSHEMEGSTVSAGIAAEGFGLDWGILGQYSDLDGDPRSSGRMDITDWNVTAFAGYDISARYALVADYAYGHYQVDYQRSYTVLGQTGRIRGEADARYQAGSLQLLPSAARGFTFGLNHYRVVVDDYDESGAAGALALQGDSFGYTSASLGWQTHRMFGLDGGSLRLGVGAYYEHMFNQDYNALDANLLGVSDSGFRLAHDTRSDGMVTVQVGLHWRADQSLSWYMDVKHAYTNDYRHSSLSGGLLYRF